MYKLFLCLRYLRSRVIAYFAMVGVALCVAMMLIVVSVMDGFLRKIEEAARGLFGDIIVESSSLGGLGRYDEFIAEIRPGGPQAIPQVEAASPFILTFGILRVPGYDYRRTVQIAGIRLPDRVDVSKFGAGLFAQAGVARPTFDPPIGRLLGAARKDGQEVSAILEREVKAVETDPAPARQETIRRLRDAITFHLQAEDILLNAEAFQKELAEAQQRLDEARKAGRSEAELEALETRLADLVRKSRFLGPSDRLILGLGISGLSFRTDRGETIRKLLPGHKVELVLIPLGRQVSLADPTPNQRTFTVVDDCRTDVASIDTETVYVPFETLQVLNNMDAELSAEDPNVTVTPPRCSQIHLKVRAGLGQERRLEEVRVKVEEAWTSFLARNPDAANSPVSVLTWRQRQAGVVGPIEKQRTLSVVMFAVISLVAVVLIFVIFYMIVFQKTKDIGVLKAVGAGSGGVAAIFLAYGAAVGLVGSVFGAIGGYYFVRNINPIQDGVANVFGFRVWDRDVFMFEQIPNEVQASSILYIVLAAIAAGLIGAVIPAFRAARMQPVEALRYE